tara:strand:- start:457 stop:654 length:198 start_codon:yes stop_codon:yes gene_type:complete
MLDLIAKCIILGIVLIVAFWDITVMFMGRPDATISAVILEVSKENPIVAFVLGVVVGHLFWPNWN